MANQTRVVLDETERPKAEQILELTGIKTFSQLFSILLVNYGDHLVSALKATPIAPPPPVVMPLQQPTQPKQLPSIQPSQTAQPKQFRPMGGL
ncbi:hypothetical protein H6F96_10130 [Microcoleus sp. FACHB-53]|nr:hypothetical protein [Microcoleus sp. FACHB-53]